MTYYEARLAEFNAMVASGMYGGAITVDATNYDAVVTPVEIEKTMKQSAYQPDRSADFLIRDTAWTASALLSRKTFTYNGASYEVLSYMTDPKEPTVSFRANLKK